MKKKYGFTLFSIDELESWLTHQQVARTVLYVQEHHTFVPNYTHFTGSNHFELQKVKRVTCLIKLKATKTTLSGNSLMGMTTAGIRLSKHWNTIIRLF